jgi:hypothetical protein
MTGQSLAFKQMQWCVHDELYSFDVEPDESAATFVTPDGRTMKLSISAWEGLLKTVALSARRPVPVAAAGPAATPVPKPKAAADLPPRAGAKWTAGESDDLRRAFEAGKTVSKLARDHGRTSGAIRYQLERLGLIDATFDDSAL